MDEEFSVLVDHPERGCVVCHKPKCVKEKQYGLAILLYIECTRCKELTIVPTGKRHNIGIHKPILLAHTCRNSIVLFYAE